MKEFISFIDFTNMIDEEKYKLLNSKDCEIERLKEEFEKLNGELRRYKSIVYLCEKVKDCDKE